jgi:hypothetical protein
LIFILVWWKKKKRLTTQRGLNDKSLIEFSHKISLSEPLHSSVAPTYFAVGCREENPINYKSARTPANNLPNGKWSHARAGLIEQLFPLCFFVSCKALTRDSLCTWRKLSGVFERKQQTRPKYTHPPRLVVICMQHPRLI